MVGKRILYINGDGIGPELVTYARRIVDMLVSVDWVEGEAGYSTFKKYGDPLPPHTVQAAQECDAILFCAVTTPPHIPNYKSAIVTLRKELDLYANLRPFFSLPNVPCIRPDLRFAIVRENTEGFYSGIEEGDDEKATSLRIITKKGSERIIRFAFEYAKKEGFSKVTLLHKASIFRKTDGLFLSCGNKIAEEYKDRLDFEDALIDSAAMRLILSPYDFQVIVTTNLFGDILSDEASALVGGLGVAPSGNYGEKIALFEPIHGSAPKYAGKDYVNPTGMLLSASMMLKYLGFKKEAKKLEEAISKTYLKNIKTKDVGGNSKTSEFIYAVERNIE